jgi:hypothetical protein
MLGVWSLARSVLRTQSGMDARTRDAVAGALAGLCVAIDDPARRASLAVYCFCRAMYMCLRLAMRNGHVPRVRNLAVWMFGLANAFIM